ncbi:hypothetical protein Tco_0232918, partial [Tanacetum coccineum]
MESSNSTSKKREELQLTTTARKTKALQLALTCLNKLEDTSFLISISLRLHLKRVSSGVNARLVFKQSEHSSRNFLPQKGKCTKEVGQSPTADTSSSSGGYTTQAVDADIGPVHDDEPFAEIRWQKRILLHLNLQDEMNRSFIAQNSYRLEKETFSKIYRSYHSLLRTVTDWKGKPYNFDNSKYMRSLLHDNIIPKPDLALELSKSISLTEAEEEVVAREVHATHARIVSESEPEPTQRRQSGIAFRDSFIVSKKRSSNSSKKLGNGYS